MKSAHSSPDRDLRLLRVIPKAIVSAPHVDAVLRRVPRSVRATWLSLESLAGRMAFGVLLLLLSGVAGSGDPSA